MPIQLAWILALKLTAVDSGDSSCSVTVDISDGGVEGANITKDGATYMPGQYFEDGTILKGCVCQVRTCLRQCCSINETENADGVTFPCGNSSVDLLQDLQAISMANVSLFHIISVPAREVCHDNETKVILDSDVKISRSGDLIWGEENVFGFEQYCTSSVNGHVGFVVCVTADVTLNAIIYCIGELFKRKIYIKILEGEGKDDLT